jgi:alkyldihydroxyacetonephosphate synthase
VSGWRTLDRASLLVEVDATTILGACEAALQAEGLSLGLEALEAADATLAVGPWLAGGARGARDPWADPADHLVAGLTATLKDGRTLVIRPSPRRAVGPDLIALVVGMEERYARIERAWLRVHRVGAPRAHVHALVAERNPPVSEEEEGLLEAIAGAMQEAR